MNIIKQHDQRDCGATCLAMVASYHGLKYPISKFRELTKTDRSGTNLYGLVDGAKQIGLNADAQVGNLEELIDEINSHQIELPLIAHTVSEDGMLHFIVIFEYKNGIFTIGDPGKGKCRYNQEFFSQIWTGYIVTFQKTEQFVSGNYTQNSLLKFFRLLKGQYTKIVNILILSIIIVTIGIVGAFIFEIVIDNFIDSTSRYDDLNEDTVVVSETSDETNINYFEKILGYISTDSSKNFNLIFIIVIILYLLQAFIQIARGYLIAALTRKIDIQLVMTYYNHLVDLPVDSLSVRQTGEYLSRFSDTDTIRNAISNATITIVLDSVMVIVCGIILFIQNWKLALVSIIMIILYAILILAYRKPIETSNRKVMENGARVESYLKESIDGIEAVKSVCAEKQVKSKAKEKFDAFVKSAFYNNMISISQDSIAGTIELVGTVIILWIGFSMVISNFTSVGSLITFYMLLGYFTSPIKNLIELQPTIQTAIVAADRLNDILDLDAEDYYQHNNTEILPNILEWKIENLNFRYGNNELILHNVNMNVKKGEKVAIVGESGCGKTTLVKLLLKFYTPESGVINLDSQNINTFSVHSIRQTVAYVSQNTFLFADTIMNNLKLGNSNISDEEIIKACKISKADDFIQALPLGYQTPLDENGSNLSGGQKQRLAIAKAILRNPQLLILDEATSHLDTITESAIKDTIFSLESNLTCIIIAHRLSTIKNCDKIYVMDKGTIIESGTHNELLSKNGYYARLWEAQ
jgi:ATP-binding cassette subfamily B protein